MNGQHDSAYQFVPLTPTYATWENGSWLST